MIRIKCFLLLLLSLYLSSCAPLVIFGAGTAAGVGVFKYYEGKLTVIYQTSFMKTWDATIKALENLNFALKEKKHDLTSGVVEAKRADDKQVTVWLSYISPDETRVDIRVGILGDQPASKLIKEEIKKELFKE